jgi:tetratricopeptide (TPR) repeat protein
MLEGLDIQSHGARAEINLRFGVPVRYLHHAPLRRGNTIRIRVDPLQDFPGNAAIARQALRSPPNAPVPLVEVLFERERAEGPVLELRFSRTIDFEVRQGSDLRSLVVAVPTPPSRSAVRASPRATGPAEPPAPILPVRSPPAVEEPSAGPPPSVGSPSPANVDVAHPFAVQLHAGPSAEPLPSLPTLETLARHRVYAVPFEKDGVRWRRLRLGFFDTRDAAEAARDELEGAFPGAWVVEVSRSERVASERSALAAPARPALASAVASASGGDEAPAALASEPVDTPAAPEPVPAPQPGPGGPEPAPAAPPGGSADRVTLLMEEGRRGMTAGEFDRAAAAFAEVLALPENERSAEAKELLGLAWERSGRPDRARAEYEEYLERHPEGDDAQRVRQRLDALLTARATPPAKLREARATEDSWYDVFGSVSTFYRRDRVPSGDGDLEDFSSQLVDLFLGVRAQTRGYDLQAEASGNYRYDLSDGDFGDESRMSSLFLDFSDLDGPLSGRFGRQWSNAGGVLGRFDGGQLSYRLGGPWKVSAVGGFPVDTFISNTADSDRYFYGLSAGVEQLAERIDAEIFATQWIADGYTDRIGVGAEVRYFREGRLLAGLVDYDVYFGELNTAQLLGNWLVTPSTSFNLLVDYRNVSILTNTNALVGQPLTLGDLDLPESEIESLAEDRTARATLATLGATQRLGDRFQLVGDASVSEFSSTDTSGGIEGFEGTGREYSYSMQLIASSLIGDSDVQTLGLRYIDAQEIDAFVVLVNGYYPLTRSVRARPGVILLRRKLEEDDDILTIRPLLGFDYRIWRFTFDVEGSYEWSDRESVPEARDDRRFTLQFGVRYDF